MNEVTEILKCVDYSIDKLEAKMVSTGNSIDCPLIHRFTPGLYTREIFMPEGALVTSRVHKTVHQFMLLEGTVSVFSENDGEQLLEAPYVGITLANTRRVLYIHDNARWITSHAVDIIPENDTPEAYKAAVEKVESLIIEPYINNILGGELKNNLLIKPIKKNG